MAQSALLVHGLPATSPQTRPSDSGTRKIWDSSLAAIGMLWAKRQGKRQFRAYHDRVFERFWRRELDIEDAEAIASVLSEVNADRTGFRSYLSWCGSD